MKIHDDHLYHGASLIQIAEHAKFTSINSLKLKKRPLRNAYDINSGIGVYLKYAGKPTSSHKEYVFTFSEDNLREIEKIGRKIDDLFVVLVCVEGREICCLSNDELQELIAQRRKARGRVEDQYVVLVKMPKGKSFRVYVNAPGQRNVALGSQLICRNAFPDKIFGISKGRLSKGKCLGPC